MRTLLWSALLAAAFAQAPAPAPASATVPAPDPAAAPAAVDGAAAPPAEVVAPEPVPARGTVIFIHGLYMNSHCWDNWGPRFQAAGFTTLAPDWPGHAGEPATLRASIPPELETLELEAVVEHYRQIVRAQPEPPVLVGHSMGGLIVQILLSEGLGKAGVAIHPAPPKGILNYSLPFFRSNGAALLPGKKPILMSPRKFQYAFMNAVPDSEIPHLYDWYVVPESKRAARGSLSDAARVDFEAKHAPLLILAGDEDHATPAQIAVDTAALYPPESGTVELEIMPGRTHGTLLEPGWEAVADKVIGWIGRYAYAPG